MANLIRVVTLNNEIEANLIEELLKEKNIPFAFKSFHDTACDGIFQTQYGWGIIEADEKYKEEILSIYNDMVNNNSK